MWTKALSSFTQTVPVQSSVGFCTSYDGKGLVPVEDGDDWMEAGMVGTVLLLGRFLNFGEVKNRKKHENAE